MRDERVARLELGAGAHRFPRALGPCARAEEGARRDRHHLLDAQLVNGKDYLLLVSKLVVEHAPIHAGCRGYVGDRVEVIALRDCLRGGRKQNPFALVGRDLALRELRSPRWYRRWRLQRDLSHMWRGRKLWARIERVPAMLAARQVIALHPTHKLVLERREVALAAAQRRGKQPATGAEHQMDRQVGRQRPWRRLSASVLDHLCDVLDQAIALIQPAPASGHSLVAEENRSVRILFAEANQHVDRHL